MEKNILKPSTDKRAEKETLCTSNDESSSNGNKSKASSKKKEVNSWDCSTPTNKEKNSKRKNNDWDSSSECQETMVEPFDSNENPKDSEDWDSESEKDSPKAEGKEAQGTQPFLASSVDSYDLMIADFSDLEKSSLMELTGSDRKINDEEGHEDELLVEDLEEFLRDDSPKVSKDLPKSLGTGTGSEKVRSNHSEGTREDTTIWMIPKSERTQSGESTSKLISSSDREKIEKLNTLKHFLKKTKSLSDVEKSKIRRRTARSSRSDYLGSQRDNYNNFLFTEGSILHRKLEIESLKTKKISNRESFDRSGVFFTEYECRAVTVEKDTPEKQSLESIANSTDMLPEADDMGLGGTQAFNEEDGTVETPADAADGQTLQPVPSEVASQDMASLSDPETGRNSLEEQESQRTPSLENEMIEKPTSRAPSKEDNRMSESWFLLDSTGHYQPVTRAEVSILLNGRSADAVLQGRREHFIPKATLTDTKSLRDSLSGMQMKESFQHFLKEEDTGGEDEGKRSIDLERKVENTLFYIQPNMNFTASIRIIPVDSEMIHIWRRTRDSGSLISSEVDLSHLSQTSVETNSQKNFDHYFATRSRTMEQTVTEQHEPEQQQQRETMSEDQETDLGLRHSRQSAVHHLQDTDLGLKHSQQGVVHHPQDMDLNLKHSQQGVVHHPQDMDLNLKHSQQGVVHHPQDMDLNLKHSQQGVVHHPQKTDLNLKHSQQGVVHQTQDMDLNLKHSQQGVIHRPQDTNLNLNLKHSQQGVIPRPQDTNLNLNLKHSQQGVIPRPQDTDLNLKHSQQGVIHHPQKTDLNLKHSQQGVVHHPQETDLGLRHSRQAVFDYPQEIDLGLRHSRHAVVDYSRLLLETRTIVDSLSENFKSIQQRLDGETNRSVALQGEVNDLKVFLKNFEAKIPEKTSKEAVPEQPSIAGAIASIQSLKERSDVRSKSIIEECEETPSSHDLEPQKEAVSPRPLRWRTQNPEETLALNQSDDPDIITVNIYTMDNISPVVHFGQAQETCSLVQSNLTMIENKMKRLQQENDILMKQNVNLKRKLREISQELEKYLAGTSQHDISYDENKELDTLRDQVCNLKLELENSKNLSRNREDELTQENTLMQQEFAKIIFSLKDWCVMAGEVLEKVETAKNRLEENGIRLEVDLEAETVQNPKNFSNVLTRYVERTAHCLLAMKDENNFYERTLNDNLQKELNSSKEISGLDQVISGYAELIDQCRKGQMTSGQENKVMEDYFAVIMEKASLMEEIKILKTENEMLLESQMEHYEKLKQTMIALKDRKSEITSLETSQKLSDDEKSRMAEMLKLYEEEKQQMEVEMSEKSKAVEDLLGEMNRKELEISHCNERLKGAGDEIKKLEKTCRAKEELINEIKMENEELLNTGRMKSNQIEVLEEEVKSLQMRGTQLEAELTSTKLFLKESQKEMTEYITHLEALVSNSQDSIEKTKQKLKESHQTINRLKNENDALDKQHQCDVKLFNKTKDELDSCKERLVKANNKLKESEEERDELLKKLSTLADCEKEKSDALELLAKEYKMLSNENADLKERADIYSKEREESLKEQKDLINKYAMLSKEVQKLQEKYRSVKNECNQRTDLIRYLESMLKENLVEYNNRTACLEQNISRIIEKIMACKKNMREKHSGVDAEIRELRRQLEVNYQERKELENVVDNYYTLMKHLENEIQDREKKVDELHARLSLEQQKTVKAEDDSRSCHDIPEVEEIPSNFRIEQLESQMTVTENELAECRKELHFCQTNHENEKKKLELTIADLRSEIKRYQLRIEVMMRNLTNCNKTWNGLITDKRNAEDSDTQALKKELLEKDKLITELNDAINKYKTEVHMKDTDLENCKKKSFYLDEELKSLQNQMAKVQGAMSATNKSNELQQRERDEMAEKLFQSIKLIMEERSTRQTIESVAMEKEKNYRNQIDQIKNELVLKIKECETLSGEVEDKKKLVIKLQGDLKKIKHELASLKGQVSIYKKNAQRANEDNGMGEEEVLCTTAFLNQKKAQNVSPERLESCMRELKEVRDLNLQLRKTEGQYQAKIVRLEDEIRDARLLIKELQGDIKTEKKSKKALRNMIVAAKKEIEKCLLAKQLLSVVADRISRHLDLAEVPCRELLSGFRLSDSSSSSKT